MSQQVLSLKDSENANSKVVVNLLPCRIHHTGPVDTVEQYWMPQDDGKWLHIMTILAITDACQMGSLWLTFEEGNFMARPRSSLKITGAWFSRD